MLIAVRIEHENLLVYYFVVLNVNLGYRSCRSLVCCEIVEIVGLTEIKEAILGLNLVTLDGVFRALASIRRKRDGIK